jgi:hypothetical protein
MKHVFSALDGFIVLISVLSGLREMDFEDDNNERWHHALRACFSLLIEAIKTCPRNQVLFEVRVWNYVWYFYN